MAAVTICSDSGAKENMFPLFPQLFAVKRWDQMMSSSFFECWVLSQLFHSPLSLSSRGLPMLKKQANKSIMYEYTCFQQQHYKEKQETCQDIQYLHLGSVTFLEENGDRGWSLNDGSHVGGFCMFTNCCDVVLISVISPVKSTLKILLKERLKR